MQSGTVLVLDDSDSVLDAVRAVLEKRGFTVVTTKAVFGFTKMINDVRPDVVVIDLQMPALSGDSLVLLARRSGVVCPIYLYSDNDDVEAAALAASCGATACVRKDDGAKTLLETLAALKTP